MATPFQQREKYHQLLNNPVCIGSNCNVSLPGASTLTSILNIDVPQCMKECAHNRECKAITHGNLSPTNSVCILKRSYEPGSAFERPGFTSYRQGAITVNANATIPFVFPGDGPNLQMGKCVFSKESIGTGSQVILRGRGINLDESSSTLKSLDATHTEVAFTGNVLTRPYSIEVQNQSPNALNFSCTGGLQVCLQNNGDRIYFNKGNTRYGDTTMTLANGQSAVIPCTETSCPLYFTSTPEQRVLVPNGDVMHVEFRQPQRIDVGACYGKT